MEPRGVCPRRFGQPEEGELRPQLLDRFGLYTEIRTAADLETRRDHQPARSLRPRPRRILRPLDQDRRAFVVAHTRAKRRPKSSTLDGNRARLAELCQRSCRWTQGRVTIARARVALAAFETGVSRLRKTCAAWPRGSHTGCDATRSNNGRQRTDRTGHRRTLRRGRRHTRTTIPLRATRGNVSRKKSPPDETDGNDNGGGCKRALRRAAKTQGAKQTRTTTDERPHPRKRNAPCLRSIHVSRRISLTSALRVKRSVPVNLACEASGQHAEECEPRGGRYSRAVAVRTDDFKMRSMPPCACGDVSEFRRRKSEGRGFSRRKIFVTSVQPPAGRSIFSPLTLRAAWRSIASRRRRALARLLRQSISTRPRSLVTFREREGRVCSLPANLARWQNACSSASRGRGDALLRLAARTRSSAARARQGTSESSCSLHGRRANVPRGADRRRPPTRATKSKAKWRNSSWP